MSNMHECLQRAIDLGEIDKTRGEEAQQHFARQRAFYLSEGKTPGEAAARAAADVKEATRVGQRARAHKVLNQLQVMQRIARLIQNTKNPENAITGLLRFAEGQGYTGDSVEMLVQAWTDRVNAKVNEVMEEVGLNIIGSSRDMARLENVVREKFGDDTGDAVAKKLARVIDETEEMLIRALNERGADIKILKNRGMAQTHDQLALTKAGFKKWAEHIETRLAWDKIDDLATGKPFADAPGKVPSRAQTARFLQDIFDSITTRGWDDRDPSMSVGGRALYNQRAEHRVLHFKDGTAQIEYNREFGNSDIFSNIMNNLHRMSRDVALMQNLGPNPKMTINWAGQYAKKQAAAVGEPAMIAKIDKAVAKSQAMLAEVNGSATITEYVASARFFSGARAVMTSAHLGSAVLSSVTDIATSTVAAQAVGMSGTNVLAKSVKLMASQATRATAARMGFIAETLADAGGGASRFMGKMIGTGIAERLAGFTLRASGLSFATDMRKIAFQMSFAGHMADNADRAFGQIDGSLRAALEARGITAKDWDALRHRSGRFVSDEGADFISPIYWLETQKVMPRAEAENLAMRVQMTIREHVEMAVPSGGIEGRALLRGGTKPGTIMGELSNSVAGYKNFAVSMMLGQWRRLMNQPTGLAKAQYAAKTSALLIAMGALAIQLKELAKGNDPRPMNTSKFWMAASFQSGGLGIFGDFFQSETSRVGGGLAQTIAGPMVGLGADILGPVASNISALVSGGNTYWGRDIANFLRRNTPVASSLFYARTAYSRLVADELQMFLDPEAQLQFLRQMQKMLKDFGTQPFIGRAGTGIETRLPDLSNAFGAQP